MAQVEGTGLSELVRQTPGPCVGIVPSLARPSLRGVLTCLNWAAELTTTGKNHTAFLGQGRSGPETAYSF